VDDTTADIAGIQARQWEHEKKSAMANAEGVCATALDIVTAAGGVLPTNAISRVKLRCHCLTSHADTAKAIATLAISAVRLHHILTAGGRLLELGQHYQITSLAQRYCWATAAVACLNQPPPRCLEFCVLCASCGNTSHARLILLMR
jgi:hypothetical protein